MRETKEERMRERETFPFVFFNDFPPFSMNSLFKKKT